MFPRRLGALKFMIERRGSPGVLEGVKDKNRVYLRGLFLTISVFAL